MKRLGARELKVGMKVQWRKGRVTNPEINEIVAVEESRTGKIRVRLKNSRGESWNLNPGNRFVPAG